MNVVLWVFIAAAFGVLLFGKIQDSIPDRLAFLRLGKGPAAVVQKNSGNAGTSYLNWEVKQAGGVYEFVLPSRTNGSMPAPELGRAEIGVLCNAGKLDARMRVPGHLAGLSTTLISIDGDVKKPWAKGTDFNVYPGKPADLVQPLYMRSGSVTFTVEYADRGPVDLEFDGTGLPALLDQLPNRCGFQPK